MLAGCGSSSPPGVYKLGKPYQISGRWYYPEYDPDYDRVGTASWYGEPFHGRATANGERFDRGSVSAAHPTLPLPSMVRVVNLANQRELVVRVNDRGPFVGRSADRSVPGGGPRSSGSRGRASPRCASSSCGLADAGGEPPQPTARSAPAPIPARPAEPAPPLVAAAPAPHPVASASAPMLAAATPTTLRGGTAPAQCEGHFIQVGAYAEAVRARRVMAELHELQAMPVSLAVPAEDHLARVRLGPIADPGAVDATLDRIKRSGFAEAFIVGPEQRLVDPLLRRWPKLVQSAKEAGEIMSDKRSRRLLIVLSLLAGVLTGGPAARAEAYETPAHAAILIDLQSGQELYAKNADVPLHPASMSKLMTVLMVFERLADGSLSLDDTLPVSEKAWRKGGSKMFVDLGSRVRVEDLLHGIIVQSGNDACIVVAEALGGTEEAFSEQMTKRGRELGLTHSIFKNASGWPDPDHLMSARDLATLATIIIQQYPQYYKIFGEKEFTYNDIRQHARNPLLYQDIGADGLKTGHTEEAGYGLTASAVRDGRRLVMVLAGLQRPGDRAREAAASAGLRLPQFQELSAVCARRRRGAGGRLVGQRRQRAAARPGGCLGVVDCGGAARPQGQGGLRRPDPGPDREWQPGGGARDHGTRPRAAPHAPDRRRDGAGGQHVRPDVQRARLSHLGPVVTRQPATRRFAPPVGG